MTLREGTRLGAYEILAPIGAGGMGEVYRARDTRLGREVAVKVLSETLALDTAARARFEREARAVAALSHPNILDIHDVGSEAGVSFAVTELLEGQTLGERLGQGTLRSPLPWRKAVEIGLGVADGLAAAHAHGVGRGGLQEPEVSFRTERSARRRPGKRGSRRDRHRAVRGDAKDFARPLDHFRNTVSNERVPGLLEIIQRLILFFRNIVRVAKIAVARGLADGRADAEPGPAQRQPPPRFLR